MQVRAKQIPDDPNSYCTRNVKKTSSSADKHVETFMPPLLLNASESESSSVKHLMHLCDEEDCDMRKNFRFWLLATSLSGWDDYVWW